MTSQVRPLESETDATAALEDGHVLWPEHGLRSRSTAAERPLLSSAVLARGKNVSFDPATGAVGGSALDGRGRRTGCAGCSRGSATRRTRSWAARARPIAIG